MASSLPAIGFIGLGQMGGPMARHLIRVGYELTVYDVDTTKIAACPGAHAAQSLAEVASAAEVLMTSVPSFEIAVELAENLLTYAKPGRVFIEFSTVTPSQAIELAAAYAEKGAMRLDVPVSGGSYGAERANLRMFVGGDEATARRCWPIFEVLGESERIVYCGPAGRGQAVKIVNQLAMGLSNAIYLETIGYAVHMGVDVDVLVQGIGGENSWRQHFNAIAQSIKDGTGSQVQVKFVQLQQFADDAAAHGYNMPLTRALFEFCDPGERIDKEEIYPAPSFWHELMRYASVEQDNR